MRGAVVRFTVALAVLGAAGRAGAQEAPSPAATTATPEALDLARRLFREGVESAEAGRWESARDRFARVLAIRPAPLVRFNLALACRSVGRFVEAIEQFRQFTADPATETDAARRTAAAQETAQMQRRLSRLTVSVRGDMPREFTLDGRGRDVALLGQELVVDPGPHTVDVLGRGGDRQRREGAVYEGERLQVEIALAPTAPDVVTAAVRTTAPPRDQSFGHWVARPGPGGRWVDWAAQDASAPRSVWDRRPFTLAVGVGGGSPTGIVWGSVRYFPQRWFGAELMGGGPSAWGAGFALHVHARLPLAAPSIYAPGLFVGPGLNLTGLTLACTANCAGIAPTKAAHVAVVSLDVGTSHEWRIGDHFTLRATLGLRWFVNRAQLRATTENGAYARCTPNDSTIVEGSPCDHVTGDASGFGAFAGLDIGYGIGP